MKRLWPWALLLCIGGCPLACNKDEKRQAPATGGNSGQASGGNGSGRGQSDAGAPSEGGAGGAMAGSEMAGAGAGGDAAFGGQGGGLNEPELGVTTELALGSCETADNCRPVVATGFPGISQDGQSVVVLYQYDPPFDLFVASYDVNTGLRGFTEPVYGVDAWLDAQASPAGRAALMELVTEKVSKVMTALIEDDYTAMTRFEQAGIDAGHDGIDSMDVVWCSVGNCFTENADQGQPLHSFPIHHTVTSDTCQGFIQGWAVGAVDTTRQVLVVMPKIVANSDLCEVSDVVLVGRYEE